MSAGPIILAPTPKPARNLQEYAQAVSVWTRQAEQAIRRLAGGTGVSVGSTPSSGDDSAYLTDAASDGTFYGRKNGAWTALPATVNADATHTGLLTSTDWNTFNGKQPAGAYLLDAASDGAFYSRLNGAWAALVSADATHRGLLTAADWNTFSGKQAAGAYLLDAPSDGSFYGRLNGAWAALANADTTHTGLLTSTDWNTFNGKQPAGAYLTDAASDGTTYGRKNGAWAAMSAGLSDAASDGQIYGRRNGAWAVGADVLTVQVFS